MSNWGDAREVVQGMGPRIGSVVPEGQGPKRERAAGQPRGARARPRTGLSRPPLVGLAGGDRRWS